MATLRYIIRRNKTCINSDGTTLIFLRYTHRASSVYFSTKKRIPVDQWNPHSQQVRKSYKGYSMLNVYLAKFKQPFEDIINVALIQNREPTASYVRSTFEKPEQKSASTKNEAKLEFEQFAKKFIQQAHYTKRLPTIKTYTDMLRILNLYKKSRRKRKLYWDDFTMKWYYDFMEFYIEERGVSNNTFGKMIKTLKTFLNAGLQQGHNTCKQFKDKRFKVYQDEVRHIYLNEQEIDKMLQLEFSENKRREIVRDLFVIACYTGLRFGDFNQINSNNIDGNRLSIKTQKTGRYVVIPLHPIVQQILNKYNGTLPKTYTNTYINRELKEIAKSAGITNTVVQQRTYGTTTKQSINQKWELLSTHCARRSFATNLFKQGFPAISIMKITGHKSQKTFMRYIKVNEEEVATMLAKHWDKTIKVAV